MKLAENARRVRERKYNERMTYHKIEKMHLKVLEETKRKLVDSINEDPCVILLGLAEEDPEMVKTLFGDDVWKAVQFYASAAQMLSDADNYFNG